MIFIYYRETNNLALSVHAPSNGVHKISAITKPSDANSDHLLEDYETDNNVNTVSNSSLRHYIELLFYRVLPLVNNQ